MAYIILRKTKGTISKKMESAVGYSSSDILLENKRIKKSLAA